MKLWQHSLSAIPLAVAGYAAAGGSMAAAVAAGLSSVLMDLDHVSDYVLYNRGWGGVRHFFASCEEGRLDRLYLALHAFEWVVLLWVLVGTGVASRWVVGLAVGMAGHLLLDWAGNRHIVRPSFYWLWFRARHRFDGNALYLAPPATVEVHRG